MKIVFALALLVVTSTGYPPQQLSRIEGIVTWTSGEPLKDARITLRREATTNRDPADYGAVTDLDGRFSFGDIASGRYRLAVTMPGYVRREYGQRRPNGAATILDFTAAEQVLDLKI